MTDYLQKMGFRVAKPYQPDAPPVFDTAKIQKMAQEAGVPGPPPNFKVLFAFAEKFGIDEAVKRWDDCCLSRVDHEAYLASVREDLELRKGEDFA